MSEFKVVTSGGSYSVRIQTGAASAVVADSQLVLIDEYVQEHVLASQAAATIVVPGNEDTKTLSGCEAILIKMNEAGARRGDALVAVGGGAIQDAATLVASLYMRGLPWKYCPSTAMAMADSCIGGKSSINVSGIKNLVGNIYPPDQVVVDPSLATDLPIEAKVSGLAEAVKICFAAGGESFAKYLDVAVPAAEFGGTPATEALLDDVLRAKKWFIEIDEFDKKERQLLNFGHTYAHAFESATTFAVPHGVAVAVGVLGACAHRGSATTDFAQSLKAYCISLLQPVKWKIVSATTEIDWTAFERAVLTDKKGTREEIRLVLPVEAGGVAVHAFPRTDEELAEVKRSMIEALAEVGG